MIRVDPTATWTSIVGDTLRPSDQWSQECGVLLRAEVLPEEALAGELDHDLNLNSIPSLEQYCRGWDQFEAGIPPFGGVRSEG